MMKGFLSKRFYVVHWVGRSGIMHKLSAVSLSTMSICQVRVCALLKKVTMISSQKQQPLSICACICLIYFSHPCALCDCVRSNYR